MRAEAGFRESWRMKAGKRNWGEWDVIVKRALCGMRCHWGVSRFA